MRKPIIAGNWKMNKTVSQGVSFINDVKEKITREDIEAVICPPSIMLEQLTQAAAGSGIKIGAQNMHEADDGAYTGEISSAMLSDLKIDYLICGHSERRQYFHESDDIVNQKVLKGLAAGIRPILCCGETLAQREANETQGVVEAQVTQGLKGIGKEEMAHVVIAYEPIWAIGTGKTATSADANEVTCFIRQTVEKIFDSNISQNVRILYGGSVKPDNVSALMAEPDIDGALVGGASLSPESFVKLTQF